MGLLLVLAVMLFRQARAQSKCSSSVLSLSSCISYVTGNSSTPPLSCCASLSNVVQSQPRCICPLLNSNGAGFSLGVVLNRTLALALPAACNIRTPSVSQCNAVANGPAPSALSPPTGAATEPSESPTSTIAPENPPGTGSKTVPTTSGSTSDGTSSIYLVVATLLIGVWIDSTSHALNYFQQF
ncbi:hypothetical protein CDL12_12900 [Handroanthus impetiginosus]|uniref:Bifunctional inhibitor/plant lipid transfer protein/seed storage helical domain-containing protein n=1 Tax=Handroanthus impetiginosus TaxID=429701 RepID=A0A2G9HAC0_9LAMI|nr:hypothetical protein CDL12_12900 [Handroanthus impetiginosus]